MYNATIKIIDQLNNKTAITNVKPNNWLRNEKRRTEMKTLLTMVMVLMLAIGVMAQDAEKGSIYYGSKIGLNLANVKVDSESGKSKTGFVIGSYLNFPLSPSISVQPELFWTDKGAKPKSDEGNTIKLSYLELPVLLKYSIPTQGSMSPYLFAGPALS